MDFFQKIANSIFNGNKNENGHTLLTSKFSSKKATGCIHQVDRYGKPAIITTTTQPPEKKENKEKIQIVRETPAITDDD